MKGLFLLIFVALVSHISLNRELIKPKNTVKRRISPQNPSNTPKERRLSFDDDLQTGSLYVQQLENTNANLSEMTGHSRLQTSMKKVGQWFGDIEERLDDFRDSVARKLNELHMSLQRPKIPIMGPAAMMMHPSMNPLVPNTLNGIGKLLGGNSSFGSFTGPQVNSMYSSPLVNNSSIGASVMGSQASMIPSQLYSSGAGSESGRRLGLDYDEFKGQKVL